MSENVNHGLLGDELNYEKLHSIGEISKIVKITTDTLRYYDEIGLVKPTLIDRQTKYRYYSDSQVMEIAQILELKQYGFSLNEIKDILISSQMPLIEIYKERYYRLTLEKNRIDNTLERLALSNKIRRVCI